MKDYLYAIQTFFSWTIRKSGCIRIRWVVVTLLGIVRILCGLAFVLQSKLMVDIAVGSESGDLWQEAILLIALIVAELLLGFTGSYLNTQAGQLLNNYLRGQLFHVLLYAPLFNKKDFHSGDLTTRLKEDVRIVTACITRSLPSVLITLTQFVGAFLLLLSFSQRLAWIIVFILPLFIIFSKILGKRLKHMTQDIRRNESLIQSHLQENLQHKVLLQALEAEERSEDKLSGLQERMYGKVVQRARFTLTSKSVLSAGFATGFVVAFLWCCLNLQNGHITFGLMTAFLQLVAKIQGPTARLAELLPGFIHASASIDRLFEIERMVIVEKHNPVQLTGVPGIRFDQVDYSYPDKDHDAVRSFSYDFTPGSHTALVGPTGAGKTTLFRLILALIRPQKGEIRLYNDKEETEVSADTRHLMTYVPQGNTLQSGTIRENLLLACPSATDADLQEALHTAVADFVYTLPEGMDTPCGERGYGLSEGQAQRIAIARGLLKDAPVLLLDEVSASLDEATAALLFQRLTSKYADRTLILITHRPSSTNYFPQVIHLT